MPGAAREQLTRALLATVLGGAMIVEITVLFADVRAAGVQISHQLKLQ